jgi:hypothetical protein
VRNDGRDVRLWPGVLALAEAEGADETALIGGRPVGRLVE